MKTNTPESPTTVASNPVASEWCIVGLDETHHWQIEPRLMAHLDRILTIYAFNRNAHTFCCELAPSYWLEAVTFSAHYKLGTPDSVIDEIENILIEARRDESSGYHHASAIEREIAQHPERFHCYSAEPDDEPADPVTVPDWIFENWNSNPRF